MRYTAWSSVATVACTSSNRSVQNRDLCLPHLHSTAAVIMRKSRCTHASGTTFDRRQLLYVVRGRHVTCSDHQPYMSTSSHRTDHDTCFHSMRSPSLRYNDTLLPVPSRRSVSSHTTTSRSSCTSQACVLIYLTAKLTDISAAIMQVDHDAAARISSCCLLTLPTKCTIARRVSK